MKTALRAALRAAQISQLSRSPMPIRQARGVLHRQQLFVLKRLLGDPLKAALGYRLGRYRTIAYQPIGPLVGRRISAARRP